MRTECENLLYRIERLEKNQAYILKHRYRPFFAAVGIIVAAIGLAYTRIHVLEDRWVESWTRIEVVDDRILNHNEHALEREREFIKSLRQHYKDHLAIRRDAIAHTHPDTGKPSEDSTSTVIQPFHYGEQDESDPFKIPVMGRSQQDPEAVRRPNPRWTEPPN